MTNATSVHCDSSYVTATPNGAPTSSLTVDSLTVNGNVNFSNAPGVPTVYDKTLTIKGNTAISVANWWGVSVSGDNGDITIDLGPNVSITTTNADPSSATGVFARAEVSGDIDIQSGATVNAVGDGISATTNKGGVSIVNTGHVTSSAGRGLYADGGFNNTASAPAFVVISNQGIIESDQAGAHAVNYHGNILVGNSGTITSVQQEGMIGRSQDGDVLLDNSGSVTAQAGTGLRAWADNGSNLIINSGTVTAVQDAGLDVSAGNGTSRIVNSGTVKGLIGIRSVAGDTTIENSGSIIAQGAGAKALALNDGDHTLVIKPGSSILGDIDVAGGRLTIDAQTDVTLGNAITGGAGLQKIGTGTLTLSGANTYTGSTTISGGTVVGSAGSFGTGAIVDNAALVLDQAADGTLANALSGTGTLTKQGAGTLNYSGDGSTFTGTTSLEQGKILLTGSLGSAVSIAAAGTLQVGDGVTAGNLRGATANNGTLVFAQPGDYDYKGALSGSGSLVKQGPGLLTLSGAYTYTGSTVVESGAVQLAAALDPETDLVIDGGTFDLGSRSQSVASLSGSGGRLALGSGTLTVDQAIDTAFGGALSGSGTFIKAGDGRLNLTGTSPFSGSTRVSGGTLSVNGSLANSPVTVGAGGTLGGNGTIGGMIVRSGGAVAPGNSIGFLHVAGNVAFQAGSVYRVEVDAAGQNDRIGASGTATLGGGTVKVLAAQGNYAPLTTYTILSADGGISGRFAGVTSNLAFLDPSLRYGADTVELMLARNAVAFTDVAQTRNQLATAGAAEALALGNPVYDALIELDAGSARSAFDALSGEIHAATAGALIEDSRLVRHAVTDRLVQERETVSVPAAYAADLPRAQAAVPMPVPPTLAPRFGFWGQGFGSWGQSDRTANTAKAERSTGGFLLGLDGSIGDAWRVGVAGGYSSSTVDLDARNASTEIDSYHAAIYAGTHFGAFALRLGGAFAWHDLETTRAVAFPGYSDALRADERARSGQVFGELGYGVNLAGIALEPFAGLAYVHLDTDRFAELGGAAALSGLGTSQDVTYGTLGLRFASTFAVSATTALTARGMVGWRHAFDDVDPRATLAFAGGTPFAVQGAPIARDALALEAELALKVGANVSLGVSYDGQLAQDAQDHAVKGNLTLRF